MTDSEPGSSNHGGTAEPQVTAGLRWYFDHDPFPGHRIDTTMQLATASGAQAETVGVRGYADFDSNSKYLACFVPETAQPLPVCLALVNGVATLLTMFDGVEMVLSHRRHRTA
jgi:hypothetical protein